MKFHARMPGQPLMTLVVGGQVVDDNVQDFAYGRTDHELVHEGRKILAGLGFTRFTNDFADRYFKGCKQRGGAVALVSALIALHHLCR